MMLDAATVRNLELFINLATGEEKHSFFWSVNRTGSAAGARRLRNAIAAPLLDRKKIEYRHDAVSELFDRSDLSESLMQAFSRMPDLERLAGRLGMGKASPRSCQSIRQAVEIGGDIVQTLHEAQSAMLTSIRNNVPDLSDLSEMIGQL